MIAHKQIFLRIFSLSRCKSLEGVFLWGKKCKKIIQQKTEKEKKMKEIKNNIYDFDQLLEMIRSVLDLIKKFVDEKKHDQLIVDCLISIAISFCKSTYPEKDNFQKYIQERISVFFTVSGSITSEDLHKWKEKKIETDSESEDCNLIEIDSESENCDLLRKELEELMEKWLDRDVHPQNIVEIFLGYAVMVAKITYHGEDTYENFLKDCLKLLIEKFGETDEQK
jgi:hypothetical protein